MEHEVTYRELDPLTVVATCTCRLTAVSVNRNGCVRMLKRKHRDQARHRARFGHEPRPRTQ